MLAGVGSERGWERRRTVCADAALEIGNLSERRVLAAGAQEVAQGGAVDAAVATLVEELEGFAVVGRRLLGVSLGSVHCGHVFSVSCRRAGGRDAQVRGGLQTRASHRGRVFVSRRCRSREQRAFVVAVVVGPWRLGRGMWPPARCDWEGAVRIEREGLPLTIVVFFCCRSRR